MVEAPSRGARELTPPSPWWRLVDVALYHIIGSVLLYFNDLAPSGRARIGMASLAFVFFLMPLILWRYRWGPEEERRRILELGWGPTPGDVEGAVPLVDARDAVAGPHLPY